MMNMGNDSATSAAICGSEGIETGAEQPATGSESKFSIRKGVVSGMELRSLPPHPSPLPKGEGQAACGVGKILDGSSDNRDGAGLSVNWEQAAGEQMRRAAVILAAVDFSADSMEAAEYAMRVAGRAGAQLVLAHAIHLNLSERGPANAGLIKAEMRRAAAEKISELVRRAHGRNVQAAGLVEEGKPAGVIVELAKRFRAELVVLAHRKRSGLARWFRRKTAEKVMREAHCPVLVLETDAPMATIK